MYISKWLCCSVHVQQALSLRSPETASWRLSMKDFQFTILPSTKGMRQRSTWMPSEITVRATCTEWASILWGRGLLLEKVLPGRRNRMVMLMKRLAKDNLQNRPSDCGLLLQVVSSGRWKRKVLAADQHKSRRMTTMVTQFKRVSTELMREVGLCSRGMCFNHVKLKMLPGAALPRKNRKITAAGSHLQLSFGHSRIPHSVRYQ